MRLFIGLFPDSKTLEKIRESVRKLDKIKRNFSYIPYDQMHLTVKFVGGDVSQYTYEAIAEELQMNSTKWTAPTVKLKKALFGFPGQARPNVIFFDVESNRELDNLVGSVSQSVKSLGFTDTIRKKERRKLTHHISIARSKRSISNSLVRSTREALKRINFETVEFVPDEIVLVASQLSDKGPVYKKLGRFPLKLKNKGS